MIEFDMDCSQTEGGWFEIKAFGTNGVGWESDINQASCLGSSGARTPPYRSTNHMALCGFLNVFDFGTPACTIEVLEQGEDDFLTIHKTFRFRDVSILMPMDPLHAVLKNSPRDMAIPQLGAVNDRLTASRQ